MENEVVNEVTVVDTVSSEGRCGFKLDAKSGLIGAGIALAGLGLFKAGKVIKQKFGKGKVKMKEEFIVLEDVDVEEETTEEETTEEETKTKTK